MSNESLKLSDGRVFRFHSRDVHHVTACGTIFDDVAPFLMAGPFASCETGAVASTPTPSTRVTPVHES